MPLLPRGRLISASFAADVLPALPWFGAAPPTASRDFERCADRIDEVLGPASSVRAIADTAAIPLLNVLGYTVSAREDEPGRSCLHTRDNGDAGPVMLVTRWGEPLDRVWRAAIHSAIANDRTWCFCCNGTLLRIVNARHTWSREYLEFDLSAALRDSQARAVLWTLLRAEAMSTAPPALETAIALSSRHGTDVCKALGTGVLGALTLLLAALRARRRSTAATVLFEHSLTVLYRVLFLLFAEARGLVPVWHPVYRDRYSLDAIVTVLLSGRPYRGLWQAVQAISRLAHAGCTAGELKVTAFNGRLFSPAHAAMFDRTPIADQVMRDAVIAVSSTPGSLDRPRRRISYRDLDVEQLGAVYEQVLDYEPEPGSGTVLRRTRDLRKSSGAFYTPRTVTAFVVRRTLLPLVRDRSSDEILNLRVVDPAMGSGAFLVATCRFLAAAAEDALIAEGRWHPGDVTAADRATLRREIAARCLYGVDVNPMAVQLGRLSLWLATLAADKPLSFLDHHLVAGDSLVGASPSDVQRQPSRSRAAVARAQLLPLFDGTGLAESLADAARVRLKIAREPDDNVAIVRSKERTLAALQSASTAVRRWARVLDLWCAGWFQERGSSPDRGTFGELVRLLLHDECALPRSATAPLLAAAEAVALRQRFLHWPLAFPEVFAAGGFDAVIGNPPWDMVRGDSGSGEARAERRRQARHDTTFFRESGVYVVESQAHVNRYQLFVERALQLVRPGGRIGLVLPSGIASDAGAAPLRRHLFDRAAVDSITGMDNRGGIFPIHRSVRFALVTATSGQRTDRIACRFGLTRPEDLDSDRGDTLHLSRALLTRLSGADDLGLPELTSVADLRIVEKIGAAVPWLGSGIGWGARFGRELHATDDRAAFAPRSGCAGARPVVEGKQIEPFRVALDRCRLELRPGADAGRRAPRRTRLAYRDVASATNRLTLIAALIPPHAATTHTLFCLKTPLPVAHQEVLGALLNSFVANYLIRLRVNTHVTASLMSRLPVPFIDPAHPAFGRLRDLAESLTNCECVETAPEYAELQALTAQLYGLTPADFEHVLGTFPLVPESVRLAAYERFSRSGTKAEGR